MKFILQCSICLQNLNNPISLNCGHTFCQSCIQNSLEKQDFCSCPLCRQPVLLSTLKTDELLPIVKNIFEMEGPQSLLNEFPQLIICLSCGLTPVNPVVLPCQHMFCLKCIEECLQQELLCPACQEFCITLNLNTNQKYKDLIEWYLKEFKIEEEQITEQQFKFDVLNGIPVFHYASGLPISAETEFQFLEFRYQELIKIVGGGSGNFVISTDLQYGDLVKVKSIKKAAKGFIVRVEGVQRLKINSVYSYVNGMKTQYQEWNTQILWFCECQIIVDPIIKERLEKQYKNILRTLEQITVNSKCGVEDLFLKFFQKLNNCNVSESSLILLSSLNNDFGEEYYHVDVEKRINLIQQHLIYLEQKIMKSYGIEKAKEALKQFINNIEIVQYPDQNAISQYLLNLFNITKLLSF